MSADVDATVFIVDNDGTFCSALRRLLASAGHHVESYDDAESFLAGFDPQQPGCVVLETHLPGINGLELQDELKRRAPGIPIIFVTTHGSVPAAVNAIKNGAAEFFEKPVDEPALLHAVKKALKLEAGLRREHARKTTVAVRLQKLTSREREIMQFVITGKMNKTMADELCISIKTVEAHRAKVMQKMGVDSVAELVQLVLESGLTPGGH
jgi:FixJ family two-component response regulator